MRPGCSIPTATILRSSTKPSKRTADSNTAEQLRKMQHLSWQDDPHMTRKRRMRILLLGLCLCMVACGIGKRDFAPLGPVTTAELWVSASDGSKYIWKISDPGDLSRISAFLDFNRTGWGAPWYGVPVPIVEVKFFDGQKLKGTFGVGKDFFETQREGSFLSKSASSSEIRGFYDVVNLDEATLKEYTK